MLGQHCTTGHTSALYLELMNISDFHVHKKTVMFWEFVFPFGREPKGQWTDTRRNEMGSDTCNLEVYDYTGKFSLPGVYMGIGSGGFTFFKELG